MRADNPEEIPVTHYCQGALPSCRSYLVQIGPTNLVIWFIATSDLLLPAQESHMERHIIPALQKDKFNLKRM